MSENLNGIQIQLLLYFLEAEAKKRTVTDAARYLNKPKSTLTHILDSLDELALMERVEGRKSVLTAAGEKTAQELLHRRKILEQYMQYQDIPPAQIKENALRALSAGFSDEFMARLAEQESRMHLKEIFAGHRNFHGGDICNYLKDGSYYFPFIIYREQIKNHNNLSMANKGFDNPCELIVKDHEGLVYLSVKTMSAESMSSGKKMEGRVSKMQYLYDGEFWNGGIDGRYVYFPVTALNFIAMGKGRDTLLHGSVCLKMQCSVGDMHMPESTAIFTMFIH
ncbi:MAG TPA: hypothetical protein H9675_06885 [Firmicutes bacterium]|nr:hypothetical protein [Bacillota bacterium]